MKQEGLSKGPKSPAHRGKAATAKPAGCQHDLIRRAITVQKLRCRCLEDDRGKGFIALSPGLPRQELLPGTAGPHVATVLPASTLGPCGLRPKRGTRCGRYERHDHLPCPSVRRTELPGAGQNCPLRHVPAGPGDPLPAGPGDPAPSLRSCTVPVQRTSPAEGAAQQGLGRRRGALRLLRGPGMPLRRRAPATCPQPRPRSGRPARNPGPALRLPPRRAATSPPGRANGRRRQVCVTCTTWAGGGQVVPRPRAEKLAAIAPFPGV